MVSELQIEKLSRRKRRNYAFGDVDISLYYQAAIDIVRNQKRDEEKSANWDARESAQRDVLARLRHRRMSSKLLFKPGA